MSGIEIFGGVAAAEQVSKSILAIVQEILRAARDIGVVPEKTRLLLEQVKLVDDLLKQVTQVPNNLKPVLEKLNVTLRDVKEKVDKYLHEDKIREGNSKAIEFTKNLVHQGGTKQKKKVRELSIELRESFKVLLDALTVGTYVQSSKSTNTLDQMAVNLVSIEAKLDRKHEEHVDPAVHFPAMIENEMVVQLIEAADIDLDNDSYLAKFQFQDGPEGEWQDLYSDFAEVAAEDDGTAAEEDERRASIPGGYFVNDECSLRFRMSVNENQIYFHFLTYAHVPGAELKVFYPTKSDMNHQIPKKDTEVLFPDRQNKSFMRGPARFEVRKEGSSWKSRESIFLVYSRNTLVRGDVHPKTMNLNIADVAEKLKDQLEKKLKQVGYDEIIVKHLMIDICTRKRC